MDQRRSRSVLCPPSPFRFHLYLFAFGIVQYFFLSPDAERSNFQPVVLAILYIVKANTVTACVRYMFIICGFLSLTLAGKRLVFHLPKKSYSTRTLYLAAVLGFISIILSGEVNNIDYVITMASVKGWDLLGSKWTVCSSCRCVRSRRNGQAKGSEWLWQGSNCNGKITGSEHQGQVLWSVPGMQWLAPIRS